MFQTTSHHILAGPMVSPETDEDRNKCPPSNSQLLQLPHTHTHAVNPEEMQDEKAEGTGPRQERCTSKELQQGGANTDSKLDLFL